VTLSTWKLSKVAEYLLEVKILGLEEEAAPSDT